jgi:hypothetical protein
MTPHEVQFPPPPDNGRWAVATAVLGIVAIIVVGTLLLAVA